MDSHVSLLAEEALSSWRDPWRLGVEAKFHDGLGIHPTLSQIAQLSPVFSCTTAQTLAIAPIHTSFFTHLHTFYPSFDLVYKHSATHTRYTHSLHKASHNLEDHLWSRGLLDCRYDTRLQLGIPTTLHPASLTSPFDSRNLGGLGEEAQLIPHFCTRLCTTSALLSFFLLQQYHNHHITIVSSPEAQFTAR